MPNNYDISFTHSHQLREGGAVAFECSRDLVQWPWLTLPPSHPTVVQTINYWASVEASRARGTLDPTKWSALTYSRWECGAADAGPVNTGLADTPPEKVDGDKDGFRLTFFDAHGNLVCRIVGAGVVFRTRDFEAWRVESKQERGWDAPTTFEYAPAAALGVETDVERFVSPLELGAEPSATGFVTKQNGLLPHHPYHDGSGDHVNANQLADAGLQFAHLVRGRSLRCIGGEMRFRHYVELGRPFTLTQTNLQSDAVAAVVHQGEKKCTDIKLWLADGS